MHRKYAILIMVFGVCLYHGRVLAREYIYIGGFAEREDSRGGIEVGYLTKAGDNGFLLNANLALYDNNRGDDGTGLFAGAAISGFMAPLQGPVSPYVGGGVFVGELYFGGNRSCGGETDQRCDRNGELCRSTRDGFCDDEDNIIALYPEAGILVDLDALMLMAYTRRYFDSAENSTHLIVVGLSIAFQF